MRSFLLVLVLFCAVVAPACADDAASSDCPAGVADTDSDGVCDDVDNCVAAPNPMQIDVDGDGVGNACDPSDDTSTVCGGRGGDSDGDMVCQAFDNCPDVVNPDQRDQDNDGFGDACDDTPLPCDALGGDSDGDTVCDDVDNCPDEPNLNQLDIDHDNIGDVCDPAVPPTVVCNELGGDADNDHWCGVYDNCPNDANPQQLDSDGDGIGDVCDVETCDGIDNDGDGQPDNGFPDTDSDGVADCVDICPNGPETDSDSDGTPDCVDPCPMDSDNDSDGDGICMPADNCPSVATANLNDKDGDGIGDACDVETCDGISNDLDSYVDEGMPDADGDGVCDDIDPCPNHWLDDVDGDGLCGDVDNCPTVANPAQTDSDGDSYGDACDVDSANACDASATLNAPGDLSLPASLKFKQLVTDPTGTIIYATLGSDADNASYGNRVMAIDPATSSILWSTHVGSEPNAIAVSGDGSIVYVGLNGAGQVRMINTAERRACLSFPLPVRPNYVSNATDIEVLPGLPESIVVATQQGTIVLDNGDKRPNGQDSYPYLDYLVLTDATTAYSTDGIRLRKLTIDASGINLAWQDSSLDVGNRDLVLAEGNLYTGAGTIVDPSGPTLVATLSNYGELQVDTTFREIYVGQYNSVEVFDMDTWAWKRSLPTGSYSPTDMVMWGDRGLALIKYGKLVILDNVRGP